MTDQRKLTLINFGIVLYFVLIYLAYYFQLDFQLISVLGELLSIPLLLAQIVFLVIGIRFAVRKKADILMIVSLLFLGICTILTFSGFF
ncbi:hypothetical protein [Fulvivirga sedimenti]|uniref:Uncharacterized protein n=1 Tax=Fulvivirga sedimenti TaxID=2879465 RepID=A0A9X1KXZ5_9BACT|nr:hypothetical protein [Fulvivirga sedimenti]MCA6074717.1 hypothetical protein [Fulvivirga sedimenti]MCA6075894.1 hypothetical protein [Fulvivirga sedimenti]MCA6077022.1 hypothetical protein [Fulvivirga sedimenti]